MMLLRGRSSRVRWCVVVVVVVAVVVLAVGGAKGGSGLGCGAGMGERSHMREERSREVVRMRKGLSGDVWTEVISYFVARTCQSDCFSNLLIQTNK